jgi:predicted dehydrogenase
VQDALTHTINAAQWLVGNIDRVVADAAHLALEGVDVEDTVNVLARHGGVLAQLQPQPASGPQRDDDHRRLRARHRPLRDPQRSLAEH